MKIFRIFFLALAVSTIPLTSVSAQMSLTMTDTPRSIFEDMTRISKMSEQSKNILLGVGVGVGVVALGYFLYWYLRPLTDQELVNKVQQELNAVGAETLQLPESSIELGLPEDPMFMNNEFSRDFLENKALRGQLTTFGRTAQLTGWQSWTATDENHLSQWCADQEPILRTQAIVHNRLELLKKRRSEIFERERLRPTGPCHNDILCANLNALIKKLTRIENVFMYGITTTYDAILKSYNNKLDKKRREEKALRIQEAQAAIALKQAQETERLANAQEDRNRIEREKLVYGAAH